MSEVYILLKEHVIHALTNSQAVTLKEFATKLIAENEATQEEIIKAYTQINTELIGTTDIQ